MTKRTQAIGMRSSSATAAVSEVRAFCPTSTLPVYAVTMPSSPMCSQALTSWDTLPVPPTPGFLGEDIVVYQQDGNPAAQSRKEFAPPHARPPFLDRKSTRLNSSHRCISYAV